MTNDIAPRSSRRLRISLASLLLLCTCIALGISHFNTSWQLYRLRRENAELRTQTGLPVIKDAHRVAVGVMPFPAQNAFCFRVYGPPGRNLVLRYAFDNADHGFPEDAESLELGELNGEMLTIEVARELDYAERLLALSIHVNGEGKVASSFVSARSDHWCFEPDAEGLMLLDDESTNSTTGQADTPRVLLRYKYGTVEDIKSDRMRTAVLVWLEDAK